MIDVKVHYRQLTPNYVELGLSQDLAAETIRFTVVPEWPNALSYALRQAKVNWISPNGVTGTQKLTLRIEGANIVSEWTPPKEALQCSGILRAEMCCTYATEIVWHSMPLSLNIIRSVEDEQYDQIITPRYKAVTVDVTPLSEGEQATATVQQDMNSIDFSFGIPAQKGEQGQKGDTGLQGAPGPQGPKGDTGTQGIQGKQGEKGLAGPQGELGPQGPVGIGIPEGGADGQALVKQGSEAYAAMWGSLSAEDIVSESMGTVAGALAALVEKAGALEKKIAQLGYRAAKKYGFGWERQNAKGIRLWDAAGITLDTWNFGHFGSVNAAYSNPFDKLYPWSRRQLVTVDLDMYETLYAQEGDVTQAIVAWEGDGDFAYDGSQGAVMVYTPEFWAMAHSDGAQDIFGVTDMPLPGWRHVPASIGGRYFGSQDGQGRMTSVANALPCRNMSMAAVHQAAMARSLTLEDIWTWSADSLLLCVEYATMNTQNAVGMGCHALSGTTQPLLAETGTTRVVVPEMFAASLVAGMILDFGTFSGGANVAGRVVEAVEAYPGLEGAVSVSFTGAPVNVTTAQFVTLHGRVPGEDAEIGGKSGYIGANGKVHTYYRGRIAHGGMWRYVLGAYSETGTLKIWLANNREEAATCDGLDTQRHQDSGVVLPHQAAAYLSGWMGSLTVYEPIPLAPFAASVGGNDQKPIGDGITTAYPALGSMVLRMGGTSGHGTMCGRFHANWADPATYTDWGVGGIPFLLGIK